jgi:hypothetical protein
MSNLAALAVLPTVEARFAVFEAKAAGTTLIQELQAAGVRNIEAMPATPATTR